MVNISKPQIEPKVVVAEETESNVEEPTPEEEVEQEPKESPDGEPNPIAEGGPSGDPKKEKTKVTGL